jgi:predicted Zn-dependent protease
MIGIGKSENQELIKGGIGKYTAYLLDSRFLIPLIPILLLTACAKPITRAPMANQAELEQERYIQKEYANQPEEMGDMSVRDRAAALTKLQRVASRVQPAAFALCEELRSKAGRGKCQFDIGLDQEGGGLNAYADGQRVVVFPEMVAFTKNDEELALVLSHEMAHNIMEHPDGQKQNVGMAGIAGALADALAQTQGIETGGMLGKLSAQGAVLRYSKGFEREADYVGMYIMARSGYAIADAPKFWRRMSKKNPDGMYVGTTHPTNPDRFVALSKAISEIEGKRAAGLPLFPEIAPEE